MQDWRSISPDITDLRVACDRSELGNDVRDRRLRDPRQQMRPGDNEQRSIVVVDGVEVNPKGHQSREYLERRFDMLDAPLDRPWAETGQVDALANGDRSILMPAESPIRFWGFVEQDRSNGLRPRPQKDRGKRANWSVWAEQSSQFGIAEKPMSGAFRIMRIRQFQKRRNKRKGSARVSRCPMLVEIELLDVNHRKLTASPSAPAPA